MFSARVLIADDDSLTRMDLRAMLEDLGHIVVAEASDGVEACRLARTLSPDVAVLDVMMPGGDGLTAAGELARERVTAVLMLTAYSDVPIVDRATSAGVLGYLVKPLRPQELQPAIEIAVARWREMSALECALADMDAQRAAHDAVARACHLLRARDGVTEAEARRRLVARACELGRTEAEVAEALLLADETGAGAVRPQAARRAAPQPATAT